MTMQAMTSAVVPTWGVAGPTSMTGVAFGLVASSLPVVLAASLLQVQCSVVIIAYACVALLTFSRTLGVRMGVPTLLAAIFGTGGECIQL